MRITDLNDLYNNLLSVFIAPLNKNQTKTGQSMPFTKVIKFDFNNYFVKEYL